MPTINTLLRGVLFIIGLLFFALSGQSQVAKRRASPRVESGEWLKALVFLDKTNAKGQFLKLKDYSIRERSSDKVLAEYILGYFVRAKNRTAVNEYVMELAGANQCISGDDKGSRSAGKSCTWLRQFWRENLSRLHFFDTTAPQLESFREFMEQKDCSNAKLVLEQIEIREGEFLGLLEKRLRVAKCLNDTSLEQRVLKRLKGFEF